MLATLPLTNLTTYPKYLFLLQEAEIFLTHLLPKMEHEAKHNGVPLFPLVLCLCPVHLRVREYENVPEWVVSVRGTLPVPSRTLRGCRWRRAAEAVSANRGNFDSRAVSFPHHSERFPPVGCRDGQTSTNRSSPWARRWFYGGPYSPALIFSPASIQNANILQTQLFYACQLLTTCRKFLFCSFSLELRRFNARLSALSDLIVGATNLNLRRPFALLTQSM